MVLRSSMFLGATAPISAVRGSAYPYRLLWMDWTCRAHIKKGGGGVVVHNAYLRRFSLTLVGALRGVITNHYQQTGGSR
jgi:hypothetical protein